MRRTGAASHGEGKTPLFVLILTLALVLGPIGTTVWFSFRTGLPGFPSPYTLGNYLDVFGSPEVYGVFLNTLWLGVGTMITVMFFAIPISWILARTDFPAKNFWMTVLSIEILIPGFLKAFAWILLLNPRTGIINTALMGMFGLERAPIDIYGLPAISIIQGLGLTPPAVFMIVGAFRAMDISLEESARVSGMRYLSIVRKITLPLMTPALMAALLYYFVTAVETFEIPAILGLPSRTFVVTTYIFQSTQPDAGLPDYGGASAMGMVLTAFSTIGLYFYFRTLKNANQYAVIAGRGYRRKEISLGYWKWIGLAFMMAYLLPALILPFLMLVWASMFQYLQVPSLSALSMASLKAYTQIWEASGPEVLKNTALLMTITATLVMTLSVFISWVVIRSRSRWKQFLDAAAFLPHAVPSVVFGLALAIFALTFRLPIYGTIFILIFGNTVKYLGWGTRAVNSTIVQIHRDLEEVGQVHGMSRLQVLRRVVLPLIGPSLINGWMWIALLALREVTLALMLYSTRNVVISTQIWSLWRADMAQAAALGVVLVVVVAVVWFMARRFLEKHFVFH
ncbi:MAG: iron ABC transporter permease [Desulfobacterales bacterium]|nr:iron ABC transporter permease [Desulfobacterales bacterium]